MNRSLAILILISAIFSACTKRKTFSDYPIKEVNFKTVKLTDHFWEPRIVTNRDITIHYGFKMCEKTGRVDNFMIAAGMKKGQFCSHYPFDDSDVYKIIEGASYTLETEYNKELDQYLDSLILKISKAQEKDGYLETWRTINPDKPLAEWWGSAPRWSNLATGHELYNLGHLYEAAAAHYQATGKRTLLNVALKSANLICNVFGPGKKIGVPGHEEVEIGLMKLYRLTGETKYLNLAKFFIDERGDSTKRKIWGEYQQDHMPVRQQREAVGHAVRAGYLYTAMTELTALTGDTTMMPALNAIWNDIAEHKLYITGGVGSRSEGEAFGKPYELPNKSAYAETCAAIAMVLWNHRMFLLTGDSKYYDFLERTLYNGLISGIGLNGDSFFYENPLEVTGDSSFNEGTGSRQPWFTCACCPSNLARFIPQIPGLIYAVKNNRIYVNLYISNKAYFKAGQNEVKLEMESGFPWKGNNRITINLPEETTLTFALRIPSWNEGSVINGDLYSFRDPQKIPFEVKVNGENADYSIEKGYLLVSRKWRKGDIIDLDFSLRPQVMTANKNILSDTGKEAIQYGPLLYCAEGVDNKGKGNFYFTDDVQFKPEITSGMEIPCLQISAINPDHSVIKLIPYSFWSNRGPSTMKVWIDHKSM